MKIAAGDYHMRDPKGDKQQIWLTKPYTLPNQTWGSNQSHKIHTEYDEQKRRAEKNGAGDGAGAERCCRPPAGEKAKEQEGAGQPEGERRTPDPHPTESSGQGSSNSPWISLSLSLSTREGTGQRHLQRNEMKKIQKEREKEHWPTRGEAGENANGSPRNWADPIRKQINWEDEKKENTNLGTENGRLTKRMKAKRFHPDEN